MTDRRPPPPRPRERTKTDPMIDQALARHDLRRLLQRGVVSFAALVYVDSSPYDFDDTTPYENAAIVCSAPNAYVGAFVRSSGVVQWNHLTAAPVRTIISTSLTLGSWQLVQARFGGGTLELRVNGGAWVSASGLGNLDIVSQVLRLGVNYGATAYLDGKYLDVITSDQKLNDTQFDLIRSELGTRYGQTL